MKKALMTSLIIIVFQIVILAGGVEEKIFVDRKNLPTELLKKSIGVITLNSGLKGGIKIDCCDNSFNFYKSVNLRDNSNPISNYGYHPPVDTLISNYRYLLIDENEKFLKIVIDNKDSKVYWISKKLIAERFYSKIKYFNDFETLNGEFLSLFDLTVKDNREIFSSPTESSNYTLISRQEYNKKLIKIIDQKGDFIKIAIADKNWEMATEVIKEELGWIKIKDDNGAINIWIIMIDLFG